MKPGRCISSLASAWLIAVAAGPALAQNSSTPGTLELYPTFNSIGARLPISGDANGDATATLDYRRSGDATWMPVHPLLRVDNGTPRLIGSLFFLAAGQSYDVRVTLRDPDNAGPVEATASASTRSDSVPDPATPVHLYVDAVNGNDGHTGTTSNDALATIGAAAARLVAGSLVHVAAGVYREAVVVDTAGTATNPIVFVAAAGAVLDGSEPSIASGSVVWTGVGSGIYTTPLGSPAWYVAWGDERLYDYHALSDLQDQNGGLVGMTDVLAGGFFVDEANALLYLRLPDRSDPNGEEIHVATLPGGFLIDTVQHVVIDGFELRYFGDGEYAGFGVDIRGSSRVTVRNCHIHNLNTGVRIRRGGSDNRVEDNSIWDTSIWSWPWDSVKAHYAEATGVENNGGRGNVVRRNRIRGVFNGVYVGEFTDTPDETVGADSDVSDNLLTELADDGLEPEGACINARFFDNVIGPVHNAVSLSPIQVGPTWVLYNVLHDFRAHALKLNNGSSGPILVYHNTAIPLAGLVDAQAMAPSLPFGPLTSRNNIWLSHNYVIEYISTTTIGTIDLDHDDLWSDQLAGGTNLVKWLNVRHATLDDFSTATGLEQHGWSLAPTFVNAGGDDFTLAAGDPLLDVGVVIAGINDVPARVPDGLPDLGAVERGGQTRPDAGPRDAWYPDQGGHDAASADMSGGDRVATDSTGSDRAAVDRASADRAATDRTGTDGGAGLDVATAVDGASDAAVAPAGCACRGARDPGAPALLLLLTLLGACSSRRRSRAGRVP